MWWNPGTVHLIEIEKEIRVLIRSNTNFHRFGVELRVWLFLSSILTLTALSRKKNGLSDNSSSGVTFTPNSNVVMKVSAFI